MKMIILINLEQFFGHSFLTVYQFDLQFLPLFVEYFCAFLNFFSEFFEHIENFMFYKILKIY